MHRSRLLIVATITVSFVITAMAFRASPTSMTSAGSLIPTAPMLSPRSGHTATLLPDGKVLIVGGMRRNQDFYKSAELYDPAAGKFQPTGEMSLGRVGHSAVLLRSGKVLIAGGLDWTRHNRFRGTLRPRHGQIHRDLENDHAPRAAERDPAAKRQRADCGG